jgi:hypothetical protein
LVIWADPVAPDVPDKPQNNAKLNASVVKKSKSVNKRLVLNVLAAKRKGSSLTIRKSSL